MLLFFNIIFILYWKSSEDFLTWITFLLALTISIVRTLFERQIVFVLVSSFINFSVFCQAIINHAEILFSAAVSEDKTSEKQTYNQAQEAPRENTLFIILFEFLETFFLVLEETCTLIPSTAWYTENLMIQQQLLLFGKCCFCTQ